MTHTLPKPWYRIACGLLAMLAFGFCWGTGHRGIFVFDQSMIFDGAWRILQGQVPYRDYLMPFPPVSFLIQAVFFRVFGVNWSATVIPACLLNLLATLSVIRTARLLLGGGYRLPALAAGLATAVSFQAPFGTLWFEQTSLFFGLLALQAVTESLGTVASAKRHAWHVAAGALIVLAIFSKQNYGLPFLPIVGAVLVVGELPAMRRACWSVFWVGVGFTVASGLVLGSLWIFSDLHAFVHSVFGVAAEIGRERLGKMEWIVVLARKGAPIWAAVDRLALGTGALSLLIAIRHYGRAAWRELAPGGTCAFLLPIYHGLTQTITRNDWENNMAVALVSACLAIGLLKPLFRHLLSGPEFSQYVAARRLLTPWVRVSFIAAFSLWTGLVLAYEAKASWERKVQAFDSTTLFAGSVAVPGLERVRWGTPTVIMGNIILRAEDLEHLVDYLRNKQVAFFVMGETTLLYGIVGVRPPQPVLYMFPGQAFLLHEIPQVDNMMVTSLERNRVRIVVRETTTFLESAEEYPHFPQTWAWFQTNFQKAGQFGIYEVWEWKPHRSASAPGRHRPTR